MQRDKEREMRVRCELRMLPMSDESEAKESGPWATLYVWQMQDGSMRALQSRG
jgi:hypothetical protein